MIAVNKNDARFATAGSAAKFRGVWKELRDREKDVARLVQTPLGDEQKAARAFFENQTDAGERLTAPLQTKTDSVSLLHCTLHHVRRSEIAETRRLDHSPA